MKRYKVVITPFAADNIRETFEWHQIECPHYAGQWLDGIRTAILGLDTLPTSHALASENDAFSEDIRQLLFGTGKRWRIFFTVEKSTVYVLHVRHGSRDYWSPDD